MNRPAHGFTLIEAVLVIAITGTLAAIVAMFMRIPVEGYFDVSRRTALSDSADGALRRMARELRAALPNSVRIASSGSDLYIEFLPVLAAGRYRESVESDGSGDPLLFSASDTSFDILGTPITVPTATSWLVVGNFGTSGADVYAGDTRSAWTGTVGGTTSSASFSAIQFPQPSPNRRFYVVGQPVTFRCQPGSSGTLSRFSGYGAPQTTQPTSFSGSGNLLAQRVSACSVAYNAAATSRGGLVILSLTLSEAGESVALLNQVQVNNAP
ncbi:type II secretion system protein J [Chitinimonas lacunae]|uniref:Type II secretion system protein J n=1 Tax=Chitinimonas lacunae TaxID=1963018 RepID=A0ABV8MYE8_9NEIS